MAKRLDHDRYIIITGAAGFVGSCLVRYLNDHGFHNLVLVDDLGTHGKWRNWWGKQFAEALPIKSLLDWIEGRAEEIQAILHLGACSDTTEHDMDYLMHANYHYSIELIEYALHHEIRVIYASSAATYGDGSEGFSDDHALLDSLRPLNPYGMSKHLFDLWALRQGVLSDLVGLKYFNLYGPNEWHKGKMCSPVPRMVQQIQDEGAISLFESNDPERFENGEQERDFLYIKNAVEMTSSFLYNEVGGIFNIGTGVPHSWNAMATAVCKALEKPVKIKFIPIPDALKGQYQNRTVADMTKYRALQKSPFVITDLEEAVSDYIHHHLLPHQPW